jgi:hypothetical protein
MKDDHRLLVTLQIFTIILVFKGISATYFASKYSLQNQLWLINRATNILTIIPIFLLASLILISAPLLPWVSNKISSSQKKILDFIAILIVIIGLLILFL